MPRPKIPLLDRHKIVDTSLAMIDEVGIDKFSIHALARALDVSSPSIYHYFKDRDELLTAVGLTVMAKVQIPKRRTPDWKGALVDNAVAYYRAIQQHPKVATLLLEQKIRSSAADGFESALRMMDAANIPPAVGLAFVDCIEGIALAWMAFGAGPEASKAFDNIDKLRYPMLDAARAKHRYDETTYRTMITALIEGLEVMHAAKPAAPRRRTRAAA
jgi:TetR/AcrR family tetracycline transcriptional repressor